MNPYGDLALFYAAVAHGVHLDCVPVRSDVKKRMSTLNMFAGVRTQHAKKVSITENKKRNRME
jgi:hypothetical protein